ncbi:MAG: DUF547 domain-containing protein, partial [Pseudomonadota bacterium]
LSDPFVAFAPGQNPIDHTIDYSIWDEAMSSLVLSMGPSLRKNPGRPDPIFGTRRQYGHVSRYRLEGSLMAFSFMNNEIKASFTEYRQDLQSVADGLDIQSLPRNEQLAYWLNLHNVALVEQIALNWPMRQPREFELDGAPLDEAKFITVKGIAMSLRDIREKIVYRHWKNPKVIYGFWRGEIGGPALQRKAFNAKNVSQLLDKAAREFVNSLRGTQKYGSKLQVSTLYAETAPFFFPNMETDVRNHIAEYANGDVQAILDKTSKFEATVREHDIADISGGARQPPIFGTGGMRVPPAMATMLQQRRRKFDIMIREGVRTGTVTFSNIDLPGDPDNKGEVE